MHIPQLSVSLFAILVLSGCGQKGPATTSQPESVPMVTNSEAAAKSATTGRTIEITGDDQMRYNVTRIVAAPGEELRVVLRNVGSMPKDAMGHNWVLLKAGANVISFSAAAAGARETLYIPENQKGQILAKIDLLGPRETGEIVFKAPAQPGEYPYLCSFPGHAAVMKGTLIVRAEGNG